MSVLRKNHKFLRVLEVFKSLPIEEFVYNIIERVEMKNLIQSGREKMGKYYSF